MQMRTLLILGIASLFPACAGHSSDGESDGGAGPDAIHTTEICKVDSDCKKDPGRVFCTDKIAVRYEIPTCGHDQRCVWGRLEQRCDHRCEDGYCITAAHR